MMAVNYSNARQNFKEYCDMANKDYETIVITRKQGGNVVMLSEEEYNNIMENLFVRSDRTAYERLLKSVEQLKAGKAIKKELYADE
jgi:antitoxin YefM